MQTKNKNIGFKIDDELRARMQTRIYEMGFKGTSEFIRYAINKALAEDDRHHFLVEKLENLLGKSMKFYDGNSRVNIEISKKIYEKNVQVEALMKQVLNTLNALSEE